MATFHERFQQLINSTGKTVFDPNSGMSGIAFNIGPKYRRIQTIQYHYGQNTELTGLTLTQVRESKGLQFNAFTSGNNPEARQVQQVNFLDGNIDMTVE